jgi:chromate transporter
MPIVSAAPAADVSRTHNIPFAEAVRVWARVAALSFGGPAGQIAVMHRILVDEKRWIGDGRFLHALNYCMLLPGPEAQQLAIYIGWLLHKTKGGLVAGTLFVLPGFVAILALSYIYVLLGNVPLIEGLFFGLKAAVLAIVVQAVVRIGSRVLRNKVLWRLAAVAFVAIFVLRVPFPVIVVAAGLIGFIGGRSGLRAFRGAGGHGSSSHSQVHDRDSALGEKLPEHAEPNARWSLQITIVFLLLWLGPVVALVALAGPENVFSRIALFFSEMAVVTFGGAYAVLAYVAQQAVQSYHWLSAREMLDGLGLAETTPGPLIMVTQFVGFLGAYRAAGPMNALLAATLGAMLTTWVTFVPCFLWIFLGAPFLERLRGKQALSAALTGITAAVVGVILNLAIWFALHALFGRVVEQPLPIGVLEVPEWATVNLPALGLTISAAVAIFRFGAGTLATLGCCALVGMALRAFGLAL